MSASKYPYETATEEQKAVGSWWWCVHHEVHLEPLTEPIKYRVAHIKANKPKDEIERRLQELAPVLHPERLPKRIVKARAESDKAGAESDKAWAECDKAGAEYGKAWAECDKAWAEYGKAWAEYGKARAEYGKAWAECDKAWAEYGKAWAEYGKARAEYGKAWAESDKARAEYGKAWAECEPELMALHKEEYPNTKWNGRSIFSEGK